MLGEAFYAQFKDDYNLKCSDIDLNESWLAHLDFRNYDNYKKDVFSFNPDYLFHLGAFTEPNYIIRPHEPTFLLHLNFLNYFEKIFLVAGLLLWLKNIRNRTLINLFFSFIFVFFWVRGISHKSGGIIGRTEFDFIFCVLFFAAYG